MSCLITCLYFGLGIATARHSPPPPCPPPQCGWLGDITEVKNPYGIIEAGWSIDYGHVETDIGIRHESSIASKKDHGFNSIEIRVKWRPWHD